MHEKDTGFLVDTSPTKNVVVSSLTRDASVEACIFDLIDNSIDAARDDIFDKLPDGTDAVIPSSYDGYEISLSFTGKKFEIVDNCGGISRDDLAKMVLRFGQTSTHELGIGIFGVGLNRALFKLGAHSSIRTDTGHSSAELNLDVEAYLNSDDWNLPAIERPSSGVAGTEITITLMPSDISSDFADSQWRENLRKEIGVRYGQFIDKGLLIKINKKVVAASIMQIRENGPFGGDYKVFDAGGGVSVHLEYGQLNEHRFTNEVGYDKAKNKEIADEFGWTVICNDRVVLMADRTHKTGWETGFHTEFYGFAGIARFVSHDPARLPWSTTKMDVDLNSPAYQLALKDMRKFATHWRATSATRKKQAKDGVVVDELPPMPKASDVGKAGKPSGGSKGNPAPKSAVGKSVTKKLDHHQYRTLLPDDINEFHCSDKLLALLHEAQRIDIFLNPYSSLALLRMMFETTGIEFYRRQGRATEILKFVVDHRNSRTNKPMTPEKELQATPSMDELLAYLLTDNTVWGATKSALRHSLDRMKAHQKRLNGVLHNPFEQVPLHFALTIRDEVTPILRHLIET